MRALLCAFMLICFINTTKVQMKTGTHVNEWTRGEIVESIWPRTSSIYWRRAEVSYGAKGLYVQSDDQNTFKMLIWRGMG